MKNLQPVIMTWNGQSMTPMPMSFPLCMRQFTIGEQYRLVAEEERSVQSHKHYFAAVYEAWQNLPEDLAARFPTAEILRHWCLVKCHYATEKTVVLETMRDAEYLYEYICEKRDNDTFVQRSDNVIKIWTAKSQSTRAMDREEFQRSKEAVLGLLSELIGTSVGELKKNAGKAA